MKVRVLLLVLAVTWLSSCKTKNEIRRDQEIDKIKQDVREARGTRADVESSLEEMKVELARLGNLLEQQAQINRTLSEDLKTQVTTLTNRVQALEQRAVSEELSSKAPPVEREKEKPKPVSFEQAKTAYEEGRYEDAAEILRVVSKNPSNADEGKKAQFLLAESYFAAKDYATAALEFAEFRKDHPKDALVPNAIYRQANAFRNMGRKQEAKLFYQELTDRFANHPLSQKAKAEMRKLK